MILQKATFFERIIGQQTSVLKSRLSLEECKARLKASLPERGKVGLVGSTFRFVPRTNGSVRLLGSFMIVRAEIEQGVARLTCRSRMHDSSAGLLLLLIFVTCNGALHSGGNSRMSIFATSVENPATQAGILLFFAAISAMFLAYGRGSAAREHSELVALVAKISESSEL